MLAGVEAPPEERPRPLLTGPSEVRVMVDRICSYVQTAHQVWLPPLPDAVPLDSLVGPVEVKPGPGLAAVGTSCVFSAVWEELCS